MNLLLIRAELEGEKLLEEQGLGRWSCIQGGRHCDMLMYLSKSKEKSKEKNCTSKA